MPKIRFDPDEEVLAELSPSRKSTVFPVLEFVVIGVGPRTVGRQHSQRIALLTAGVVTVFTKVLGPLPQLLIILGNILTPGRGFSEGPFSSEAELRELVDLAEASRVIESGERAMIHSVFELGDTIVREVMVPRTEVTFLDGSLTVSKAAKVAAESPHSRYPVVGRGHDNVLGFVHIRDLLVPATPTSTSVSG